MCARAAPKDRRGKHLAPLRCDHGRDFMSQPEFSYDPRCEDLARVFLDELPNGVEAERSAQELAQTIQDAIENWLTAQGAEE